MNKKLMLICAPVSSRSGYGAHARDLVWSFIQHDKYDIKILDVRWGDTPKNALNKDNTNDKKILECILPEPNLDRQPDIYVDIRIPNEFETYGKFNIGITAGIETNAVSGKWLEGCNKMDLVIVPSEHSKMGFVRTVYDAVQNAPDGSQQKVGELKLEKPIEVLFEGADEEIYKPLDKDEIDSDFFDMLNDKVPEKSAFLFVGQWTKGGYGEDRKDIGRMIKVFYESFANKKKQPALILKTSGATFSIMDREDTLSKIKDVKAQFPSDWVLPNVYLLHGNLSAEEMNFLYNHPKVKSMISFTHGEGFGRPLLEATMTGLSVIASNWSGQLDFLDTEKSLLLSGELQQVPQSAVWKDIVIPESQWFTVDEVIAYKALNYAFDNSYDIKRKAKSLMRINREKYKLSDMIEKLDKVMEQYTSQLSTQVGLKLPKLKKVDKSELPKIKLPKLKKVTEEV
jgi:glycosyltransferase involved in cell wall biosynthesis|tara:strand:+ start:3796 stop:5160 length:1365 start_codon:yes stop_codon:yes gene_type:complete